MPLAEGLRQAIDYFRGVDLESFRKPTDHTAHKNSERSRV